jgi:small subunit ribosomal protein S21
MLIIELKKGESIDVALKRLKFKFRKTRVTDQLKERLAFEKPSARKRRIKMKAVYKQKLEEENED